MAISTTGFVFLGTLLATSASLLLAYRPNWLQSWSRAVLGVLVVVTVLAAHGLLDVKSLSFRIRIDASSEPLLALGDPANDLYHEAVRDFGHDEIYSIGVVCDEVFSVECLSSLERVSHRVARLDGIRTVSSLVDVTSLRWVAEDDSIDIKPFIREVPQDPVELSGLRERALADSVYSQTLVAEDAKAAAINVAFQPMDDADFLESGLDSAISEILREELALGQKFHVAGRPHIKVHVYQGIVHDLRLLIPLAVVVMAAVLWFFFRTLRGVLIPLGTAVAANIWTFGALGGLGESLNLLTGLLGPLLLAIGSVYGVHVVARYEEHAPGARDPVDAARRSLEEVRLPALIAGLTTISGFAALLVTDVPAVYQLGLFAMLGISASTFLALVGIPAILALLPLPGRASVNPEPGPGVVDERLDKWLAGLARTVARRSGLAIGVWVLIAGGALAMLPRIEVDTDYLSYFAPSDPLRQDFEAINRLLAGVVPIYVVIDAEGGGSFRDPELVKAVDALEGRLSALPGISRSLSFNDLLGQLNRAFHGDDPREERVPDTRAEITELLFMLPKDELSSFLTVDHGRANVILRTGVVGSSAMIALEQRLQGVIDANPLPKGGVARLSGNALLLAHSADAITRAQPRSVAIAAIAILLLISLALRSFRLGFVAMIPNLVPVLIFFGLLGAGVAPLSLPVSLIGSMALGIAIDDSAHFLVRYRRERSRGIGPEEAVVRCNRRIGRPIAITSVMLCLGFAVVTASRFATLQEFGLLSALTMGVCLATDLVLLPAVLVRWRL